jgi:uncharacterized coiled-coil protein SlyX
MTKAASLTAQIAERDRKISALVTENQRLADGKLAAERALHAAEARVASAKEMIAELREEIAEQRGYIRRSHEQEDELSERIPMEERPAPPLVPRSAIARGDSAGSRPYTDYEHSYGAERGPKKHWTAL